MMNFSLSVLHELDFTGISYSTLLFTNFMKNIKIIWLIRLDGLHPISIKFLEG